MVVAAVLAGLAILAVATTVVFRFVAAAPAPTAPTPTGSAPVDTGPVTEVRLSDDGDSVTLRWVGPAEPVPVVVSGAPVGEPARLFAALQPGSTSYTTYSLDPAMNYCFTVLAVYSTELSVPSGLVCTQRYASPSPSNPQPEPTP